MPLSNGTGIQTIQNVLPKHREQVIDQYKHNTDPIRQGADILSGAIGFTLLLEQTMKNWMDKVLRILTAILEILCENKNNPTRKDVRFMDLVLISQKEVLEKLGMSERTYRRNVKEGKLRPMRLSGYDQYFEEDLLEALEESRRKGRI